MRADAWSSDGLSAVRNGYRQPDPRAWSITCDSARGFRVVRIDGHAGRVHEHPAELRYRLRGQLHAGGGWASGRRLNLWGVVAAACSREKQCSDPQDRCGGCLHVSNNAPGSPDGSRKRRLFAPRSEVQADGGGGPALISAASSWSMWSTIALCWLPSFVETSTRPIFRRSTRSCASLIRLDIAKSEKMLSKMTSLDAMASLFWIEK